MSIDHIARFESSVGNAIVPAKGFGVPLFVGFTTVFPERVRTYAGDRTSILGDMLDDGFVEGDSLYVMVSKALQQEFAPDTIKIGRLDVAHDQAVTFTPVNVVEGSVYTLAFRSAQGTETATYTVQAADTADDIATALDAAIAGFTTLTQLDPTDNTGSVTIGVDTPGQSFGFAWDVNGKRRPSDATLLDGSTHADIAAQLTALEDEDDTWFAAMLDVESVAIATAALAWAAPRKKMILTATSDSNATASGTATDIGSVALASANRNAICVWEPQYRDFTNAAIAGTMLPREPGSASAALKSLRGVTAADLPGGLHTALQDKAFTTYRAINATQALTEGGHVSDKGATGQRFFDVTRGLYWLEARMAEATVSALASGGGTPYTAEGLFILKQAGENVMSLAIKQGVLSPGDPDNPNDPPPYISLPAIGDAGAEASDRAARNLDNFNLYGRIGSKIHKASGKIKVNF